MGIESKRQQRFAGVIQQDLAELFQREGNSWAPGAFITVTKVRVTPDLAIARVYLSFLNTKTAKEDLEQIRKKKQRRYVSNLAHALKTKRELFLNSNSSSMIPTNM